jgi:AhpD family alkylhydroperoxidase
MERITFNQIPSGMVEKLMAIENYLHDSSLEIQLLELIRLRVAQINRCAYCVDMHYKELKHTGETELRLSSLCVWSETPFFTEKERAVLRFTEALTEMSSDDVFEDIFNSLIAFFSKDEISNLTFAIAQINTWTRLTKTFKFTPGNYEVKK